MTSSDPNQQKQQTTASKASKKEARAKALRANLIRRKMRPAKDKASTSSAPLEGE